MTDGTVFHELIPMIGDQHDDRIVEQATLPCSGEEFAETSIGVTNFTIVRDWMPLARQAPHVARIDAIDRRG